ncbi:MAG: hypothetical protein FJ104_09455, partial [Deltaproteobacteria bacterium]|nr:hypothetical protein [Deltaproteobacteria bacterium]
ERYLGKRLKDIDLSLLVRDIAQGALEYGVEIPTELLLVGKAAMTLEGIGKALDPDLDVFEEARPRFVDLVKRRYSPERLGSELLRRIERLSGATSHLPEQVAEVLDDLRLGRLTVRTSDADAGAASDRLGRRIYSGIVGGSLVLAASLCLTSGERIAAIALFSIAALWLFGHQLRDAIRTWTRR